MAYNTDGPQLLKKHKEVGIKKRGEGEKDWYTASPPYPRILSTAAHVFCYHHG